MEKVLIRLGTENDIASWMKLVRKVAPLFPGLETEEAILEHEKTVLKFMSKGHAICAVVDEAIVGVILFSTRLNMICFLAVDEAFRRMGIGKALLESAISSLDRSADIVVSTYVESDSRGLAARTLYSSFGFVGGEITVEFGCPNQLFRLPGKSV